MASRIATSVALCAALLALACVESDRDKWIRRGARPATGAAFARSLSGNTLEGYAGIRSFTAYLATDGKSAAVVAGAAAKGSWRVREDFQLCLQYDNWLDGAETCAPYYQRKQRLWVFDARGKEQMGVRILPGNPKQLHMETDLVLARRDGYRPMTEADAIWNLVGNTMVGKLEMFGGINLLIYYADDGKLIGSMGPQNDRGKYRIRSDGRVCTKWNTWLDGRENCGHLWTLNGDYAAFAESGQRILAGKVFKGFNTGP